VDGGEEVRPGLLVAGGDGAEALERVEAACDAVAKRVELPVEAQLRLVRRVGFIPRARIASTMAFEE